METIIKSLDDIGITRPEQIRHIAELIVAGSLNSHILTSAEIISNALDYDIAVICQQVLGGQ
jgi:hypothetical protein